MTDLELIEKYIPDYLQKDAKEKLKTGYPVQYIIGNVEFYNSIIKVNENVLIPRFETEYLVDETIKLIKNFNMNNPKILEIGTGSGCISIALKKFISSNILAIDISESAINLAKENAKNNNVDINFKVVDIHDFNSNDKYDVIISNPPYVPYDSNYDDKIKYEPENAIFASDDGIYFYKIILDRIKNNLQKKFIIAFEIGDNEGSKIKELVNTYLPNSNIKILKDYNNYERYMFIISK